MKSVWKFPLRVANSQCLQIPAGAKILSVQAQGETVCLWALCDTDALPEPRYIAIHGTGHEVYDGLLEYISTFQMHGGALVFHAFEHTSCAVETPK